MTSFKRWKELLDRTRCGQLVQFIHATIIQQTPMVLTELMCCDLDSFLYKSYAKPSLQERMKIAYDIAIGMNWLHAIAVPHGGLKPRNVLMNSVGDWHLSDFGLSRLMFHNTSVRQLAADGDFSYRYLSPEFILTHMNPVDPSLRRSDDDVPADDQQQNDGESVDMFAADVYSFGVILYELVYLRNPFEGYTDLDSFYEKVVKNGERPELVSTGEPELDNMLGIAQCCWDQDPNNRPCFDNIVQALCEVMLNSAIPPSPARDFWFEHFCQSNFPTSVPWSDIIMYLPPALTEADLNTLGNVLCERLGFENKLGMTMQRWYQCYLWFGFWFDLDSMPMILAMLELFNQEWFHGALPRDDANQRLACRDTGYFLVRLSFGNCNFPLVLSVRRQVHKQRYNRNETRSFPIQRLAYEFSEPPVDRFYLLYESTEGEETEFTAASIPQLVKKLEEHGLIATPCPKKSDVFVPYAEELQFGDSGLAPFSSVIDDIAPVGK